MPLTELDMTDPGPVDAHQKGVAEEQTTHRRISSLWACLFLGWMTIAFGAYFYYILTVGGRLERLITMLESIW